MGVSDDMFFRGRKVHDMNGYPVVYWPEHPICPKDRWRVYIHRIIAYEKYGELPDAHHVHHKDGNRYNWHEDNLELLSTSKHTSLHNKGKKVVITCGTCGERFDVIPSQKDRRKYCSISCSSERRTKIDWPNNEKLEEMVWSKPVTHVAEELGVSDKAVSKRCKRLGIETPGRGYWQKKKSKCS